jgi:hypothetical protein
MTVQYRKAPKFGPHGNLEPFLASSVASLDDYVPIVNRTEFANLKFFYNFQFLHYSVERVLIASPSEKKVQG